MSHTLLPEPIESGPRCGATIVCIDDDPDISLAIRLMLSRFDVEVIPAFTGEQGIWQALSKRPDLVITDCRMPQGDGDMVLDWLKSVQTSWCVPVIVLTGLRDPQLESHMKRHGAVSYLLKPVSAGQLVAEIGRHLTLRERDAGAKPTIHGPGVAH